MPKIQTGFVCVLSIGAPPRHAPFHCPFADLSHTTCAQVTQGLPSDTHIPAVSVPQLTFENVRGSVPAPSFVGRFSLPRVQMYKAHTPKTPQCVAMYHTGIVCEAPRLNFSSPPRLHTRGVHVACDVGHPITLCPPPSDCMHALLSCPSPYSGIHCHPTVVLTLQYSLKFISDIQYDSFTKTRPIHSAPII